MDTKSLLYGIIGFMLGGFIVSVAAMMQQPAPSTETDGMTMQGMTMNLTNKSGDEYDKAFIAGMIVHHEGAIEMAKLSAEQAKHQEIKKLSADIIVAQQKEIDEMKKWQRDWGYGESSDDAMPMMH